MNYERNLDLDFNLISFQVFVVIQVMQQQQQPGLKLKLICQSWVVNILVIFIVNWPFSASSFVYSAVGVTHHHLVDPSASADRLLVSFSYYNY